MSDRSNASTILITGGAGYIGSQLVRDLAEDPRFAGCTLRIYDNVQRHHYCGLMDLPPGGHYEFIPGDILDRFNLARAMRGVSAVVHLAALVSTPMSFDHPEWTEQINHWGTASVVDCALDAGVRHLLYVSSSSVYGPGGPFTESDPCRPVGPYAISKQRGEEAVVLGGKRGLDYTIVRLGTAFGNAPAMRFDATGNRFAYLVGVGQPMVICGSGEQVRPLIHVRDASRVLLLCLTDPRAVNEIVNAATANASINDVAQTLLALEPRAEIRYTDQNTLSEVSFSVDPTRLRAWGFAPRATLREGLEEVLVRWRGYR